MFAFVQRILDWFKGLFWREEMELTLIGLQNSGKTTFVNLIASGQFVEDTIPTVGFTMRKITKGGVTIKVTMEESRSFFVPSPFRFGTSVVSRASVACGNATVVASRRSCKLHCWHSGVLDRALRYMVDAADLEKIEVARQELKNLLEKPSLQGIPLLVLGNKRDLSNALEVQELIQRL